MFTPQGKSFAFYSCILPSRCLDLCEIQSDTCFSLSLLFLVFVGVFLSGSLLGWLVSFKINLSMHKGSYFLWHRESYLAFLLSSNGSSGLHFARPFSLCTVLLVYGSGFAGWLFISQLQIPTESQLLFFLLLQTVPSAALQEIRLSSSPVNMSSCAVSSIIGRKITPAYFFIPRFLCLSSLAFVKDNAPFAVTSLVSKQMPLWDQLLLYKKRVFEFLTFIQDQ